MHTGTEGGLNMKKTLVLMGILGLVAATVFAFQNEKLRTQVATTVADAVSPVREIVVPPGTPITVRLENRVGTGTSRVGDPFRAKVAESVWVGDQVVIPGGAEITGHVAQVQSAGHVSGHGELQLAFDELTIGSDHYALSSRSETYQTKSSAKRSAALIGGGAVLGGVIGGATGHSGGSAAKGAVIGGLAGTAASMASPRPELTFEPDAALRFRLDHEIRVRVRPA